MGENPIKKLRENLGWNQARLAQAIGRSWQSVQNYEAGKRVPLEVVEKLKTIAAEHGLADIALEISSEEWQVRRVFQPGETIISQARKRKSQSQPASGIDPRTAAHGLLDLIYDSGRAEAIEAVDRTLEVLTRYVQLAAANSAAARRKHHASKARGSAVGR